MEGRSNKSFYKIKGNNELLNLQQKNVKLNDVMQKKKTITGF